MGLSIPTVEKFLFCLTLETGGLILGYISAIFAAIGLLGIAISFFVGLINGVAEGKLVGFIIVCLVYILYFCVVFYASVMLVRGTKNKEPEKMKLYLILMLIGVVISFIQILTVGLMGLLVAFVSAFIVTYFFICIYSLYKSLQ